MTLIAFTCLFASIFLHIFWNALAKTHSPSSAFFLLMACSEFILQAPFLFFSDLGVTMLPARFWIACIASIIGEGFYMLSLAKGYQKADISLYYPIVRALPVAMLAVASMLLPLGRKAPSAIALGGMILIAVSCLVMSLPKRERDEGSSSKRLMPLAMWGWCLLGAVGTSIYTVADNICVNVVVDSGRHWGVMEGLAFLAFIQLGLMVTNGLLVLTVPGEKEKLKVQLRSPYINFISGTCSGFCYVLVLFAMKYCTSPALVFAFRQMGLPLGFLTGVIFLHEKATCRKIIGIIGIVAGLLISLG